jgi:hypothetical protein
MKPSTSVLVEHSSPSANHSVLAAPTALARASGFDSASACSLWGMVTDEAAEREPKQKILELVGRHRLDDVAALDAERPQPVTMDQRRARMRRRPTDQAGGAGFGSTCHARPIGQARAAVNDHGPQATIIDIS